MIVNKLFGGLHMNKGEKLLGKLIDQNMPNFIDKKKKLMKN